MSQVHLFGANTAQYVYYQYVFLDSAFPHRRAYIAQGNPQVVLAEVPASETRPPLRAVRALAEYTSNESDRPRISEDVNGWRSAGSGMDSDEVAAIVAATILTSEGRTSDAFKAIAKEDTMEK